MTPQNELELHGNFLTHPFAELAAEIAQARLTGSLRISSGEKKFIVYFNSGNVRFAVSNVRSSRLFDILLRQKRLTSDDLKQIPNFTNDLELANFLETNGFLTAESRAKLFVEQINGILIDAMSVQNGDWIFSHLTRLRDGLSFDIDSEALLTDYARCLTVGTILSRFRSLDESFTVCEHPAANFGLNKSEINVLSKFATEPITIQAMIELTGLPESETIRALYALWLGGLLVRSDWNPAFSHMKVAAILDAKLELKQEAKIHVSKRAETPAEVKAEAAPEPVQEDVLTLEEYLERVEKAETLYDVLGVPHTADLGDIRKAYFSVAKAFHPDHFHKDGGNLLKRVQNAFTELTHAHETLKIETTRETYDFKIRKEIADRDKAKAAGTYDEHSNHLQQAAENFERGYNLLMNSEPAASLPFFARAVHFDPKTARYHAYYGRALSEDGNNHHKAESEMQAAARLDPDNPAFRVMLAEFFIQMKLMKRAEGELVRLLASFPNNREARELYESLKSQ